MVNDAIDLNSSRALSARLSKKLNKAGYFALISLAFAFFLAVIAMLITKHIRYGLMLVSPALLCLVPALWWRRYLSVLPATNKDLTSKLSREVLANLDPKAELNAATLWAAIKNHWQVSFIAHHLLIGLESLTDFINEGENASLTIALAAAGVIADKVGSQAIEPGFIAAGLMLNSKGISDILVERKGKIGDVEAVATWLGRNIVEFDERDKQNFGGIGRDWAFGYTPLLNKFGLNISRSIMRDKVHFGWLTGSKGVMAIEAALENHAKAVAVIGQVGIGKSSSVYALAQRLIEGKASNNLAYHQVVGINATDVISNTRKPGDIEYIMLSLANEAAHAGHIILFLDDAEAFFAQGTGSFDGAQVLQSIIGAGSVQVILAMTPNGYQNIKAKYPSLASLITPVTLTEFNESDTIHVLEDTAVGLENKHRVMVSYEALLASYELSGRYSSDEAYPGKAVSLITQSIPYAVKGLVIRSSIEAAVENMFGVKVGSARPAEAEQLLNLETQIHERMINQDQAVSVVSNALRRARAGVTNPNRPVGGFLFLGPTGVGKTELAKALAATYFGSEDNMIRLDMSEYQSQDDVARLLSDGANETKSLILSVRQKPFSVVLLDEIEKANPGVLDLMLQLLDEGQLTDSHGRSVSFKDCIIIATSNAGAQSIRRHIEFKQNINDFHDEIVEELIKSQQFKPELINRFDEVVIFRPLEPKELAQVVKLMLNEVNKTLNKQNIEVSLTDNAVAKIVEKGYDPSFGARPMRRVLQKAVEDTIANKILRNEAKPGDKVTLDADDLSI